MIRKSYAMAALAAGAALCISGFAQGSQQSRVSAQEQNFLKELAAGNRAEVQMGQMAEQKAVSPQVKEFGQRMVNDHSQLENSLASFASSHNLKLPANITPQQHQMASQLSGLSGQQFDHQYMQTMVQEHQKDVREVQQQLASAQDPAVQDLLRKTLAVFQSHLRLAESIAGQMGISGQSGMGQQGQ